jgi:hypothetical protein
MTKAVEPEPQTKEGGKWGAVGGVACDLSHNE